MGHANRKASRFRAQRVLRAVDQLLETQRLKTRPPWYASLQKVPPPQSFVRPVKFPPPLHIDEEAFYRPGQRIRNGRPINEEGEDATGLSRRIGSGGKGQSYKPKPIQYPEDRIRTEFFGDHPWELARPRVMMELGGGYDARQWDWGRGIEQPGKQLDGESVVQRQHWLMTHAPFPSKAAAYDIARKEFYAVRRKQEVERRVAREEALAVGAIFGPSALEFGMQLEDKAWNKWRVMTAEHLDKLEVERSSQTLSLGLDPDKDEKEQEKLNERLVEEEEAADIERAQIEQEEQRETVPFSVRRVGDTSSSEAPPPGRGFVPSPI